MSFSIGSLFDAGTRPVKTLVNKEGHRVVGSMIGKEANRLEAIANTRLQAEAHRVLPKFAEKRADRFITERVHQGRVVGEKRVRDEASKIRL